MSKQKTDYQAAQFLSDLTDNIKNILLKREFTTQEAHELAYSIAKEQRMMWGGQVVYFPIKDPEELSRRDQEIYAKFNGENHSELAYTNKVSIQHIYRIIKLMRSKDLAKRQARLPNT